MTVPRNCLSPHTGERLWHRFGLSAQRLSTASHIHIHIHIHLYTGADRMMRADSHCVGCPIGMCCRMCRTAARASPPDRYVHTVRSPSGPRRGWDGSPASLHVCALRVRQVGAMRSCAPQGCILRPARLPDTIISTNEPSSTPSNVAGGTAPTLKHSPGPPFRVVAGWMLQAGSVDLHRSGQSQGQPWPAWPSPGPKEIDHCASHQPGGRVAAISGRPLLLFSPVRPGPSGWVNF